MKEEHMPVSLKILCEEINIDNQLSTMVLEARKLNSGSKPYILRIARELLVEEKTVKQELLKRGGPLIRDLNIQLPRILDSTSHEVRYVTAQAGWHRGQYVSRFDEVPDFEPDDLLASLNEDDSLESKTYFDVRHTLYKPAETVGSVKAYLKGLAEPMSHSRPLILVMASALAAPLADLIGRETGFAFNLAGPSSLGKTLASRTSLSTTTRPVEMNLASFGDTPGYLLQKRSAFGGSCVPFTDPKAAKEKHRELCDKIQTIVFANADGVQRNGMTYDAPLASRFQIQLFNSEKPMSELFRLSGRLLETGDIVRLIDISIRKPNGIFDKLDDESEVTSRQLAKMVEETIMKNHGVLLPNWINYLANEGSDILKRRVEKYEQQILELFEKKLPEHMSPLQSEHYRIAKSFALVSAAGCIAADKGMFPVSRQSVHRSVRELFYRVVEESLTPLLVNSHTDEIEAFESFIKSKSLPFLKEGETADEEGFGDGFRRKENGKIFTYVRLSKIQKFITDKVFLEKMYFPDLRERGCLIKGKPGWTKPIQQKGLKRRRYVVLKQKAFEM